MSNDVVSRVRQYYDDRTTSFVTHGQGGHLGAIHRAVWGPGAVDRDRAFRYVEDIIVEHLRNLQSPVGPPHVVDLGCGTGMSLCYLAQQIPIHGTGITLSPVQVQIAKQNIRNQNMLDRITCLEGNYCHLPPTLKTADCAFAIESFVHAQDPTSFFSECRRLVRPGGSLIICDDFTRKVTRTRASRTISRYKRGWRVNTLIDLSQLLSLATNAGFIHKSTTDLTSFLELQRPRDHFLAVADVLLGWLPLQDRFGHLTGGNALRKCLRRGWIEYDLVTFQRDRRPLDQ